jgi:signal transduction histidine kinase
LFADVLELVGDHPGFEVRVDKPAEVVIHTPKTPLQLVLRNLISNAMKHHDRAEGRINVFVDCNDGPLLEFRVQDDGPGIPEEFQDKIFQMFQALKPRDRVEGTGMGLALCRKLVLAHGGRLWVESSNGSRGTTFGFTWPTSWQPNPDGAMNPEQEPSADNS